MIVRIPSGGFTVLCTKAISTLLSLRGFEIFAEPITYPIIALLAATGLGQIKFLNRALMTFDSKVSVFHFTLPSLWLIPNLKVVIPTQFVLFTMAAIIGSAVLYRDFEDMSFHRFEVFVYGCLTTFLGVYLLTRDDPSQTPQGTEQDVERELTSSPRPSTPTTTHNQDQGHLLYSLATTFTPLLTPRTIRIAPEGTVHTLRGRSSRASLAGISPGYLLLATSGAGSPDLGNALPLYGPGVENGQRRRTRSESRTPLLSGSLEEEGELNGERRGGS